MWLALTWRRPSHNLSVRQTRHPFQLQHQLQRDHARKPTRNEHQASPDSSGSLAIFTANRPGLIFGEQLGRRSPSVAFRAHAKRNVAGYSATLTLILAPARTLPSVFTSPSAFAQMLQGLASLVSSPLEIGVRPKPIAMALPFGQ